MSTSGKDRGWTFLTNHAVVYFHLLDRPRDTIREISDKLNLAERTVAGILADLRHDGYVDVEKNGKQNIYSVNSNLKMRPPLHSDHTVEEFFGLLNRASGRAGAA